MDEFILEYEMEKIKSAQTKKYLKEVISSYNLENYRSAIVTLYSVVMFDFIEKIKILGQIYNDEKAKAILDEIEKHQKNGSKYSEIEKCIIEGIKKSTQLLNEVEYQKIMDLKKHRHWCAHPVYDNDYKLINPNREEVRMFIRVTFESVFQKEALLSKDILTDILQESSEYYNKMGLGNLRKYLEDKFYNKMNDSVKDKIFESLWRIVFICDDEKCNETRISSYYALKFLIDMNPNYYYKIVKEDSIRYSNISIPKNDIGFEVENASKKNSPVEALIYMLAEHDSFYKYLSDSTKAIVQEVVHKNIEYLTISYYLSNNMSEHLNKVKEIIKNKSKSYLVSKYDVIPHSKIKWLYNKANDFDSQMAIKKYIIDLYINSLSYFDADWVGRFVAKNIEIFNENELKEILEGMNQNNQIYESRNKKEIVSEIIKYLNIKKEFNIDISTYKNLI